MRTNTNFSAVMAACASPIREGAWITHPFIAAYERLHELGWAHSVETYNEDGHLVGGLYGVRVGGLFAGESMFHLQRDASKVALMHLVEHMPQYVTARCAMEYPPFGLARGHRSTARPVFEAVIRGY
jgi:leucyl/phenylalanyl-tRNA--protein transferase